jgi:hypothetical protein
MSPPDLNRPTHPLEAGSRTRTGKAVAVDGAVEAAEDRAGKANRASRTSRPAAPARTFRHRHNNLAPTCSPAARHKLPAMQAATRPQASKARASTDGGDVEAGAEAVATVAADRPADQVAATAAVTAGQAFRQHRLRKMTSLGTPKRQTTPLEGGTNCSIDG